jgi:dihydrofolate synthase / folylpolyglutamate synthase
MSSVDWLASLSPWPADGFGTGRIEAVLRDLGDPQRRYPSVHVVGTNGKSTATRTIEALLLAHGLHVGATVSPHVRRWSERITVAGAEADLEAAVSRVREACERHGATQFETITAAALTAFADAEVDAAVIEAGLGGRHDATNVLHAPVVLLTNVGLDHTDVLGETLEEIATEKLAVVGPAATVVMPDDRYLELVPAGARVVHGGAREAAEAFVGQPLGASPSVTLPGRLERREGEIRDGAHNPDGMRWLVSKLDPADHTIVASILRDKDVDGMLDILATLGTRLVATRSTSGRALDADELARAAVGRFTHIEAVAEPTAALVRAHELGRPVLVTGSLYLLADLEGAGR